MIEASNVKEIKSLLEEDDLRQLIKVPTHVSGITLNWIILPNDNDFVREPCVSNKAISDHHLLLCDINMEKLPSANKKSIDTLQLKKKRSFRCFKKFQ